MRAFAFHAYNFLLGNEIIGWRCMGEILAIQYGMFMIYRYFCNLIISSVIISILRYNLISVIVKV